MQLLLELRYYSSNICQIKMKNPLKSNTIPTFLILKYTSKWHTHFKSNTIFSLKANFHGFLHYTKHSSKLETHLMSKTTPTELIKFLTWNIQYNHSNTVILIYDTFENNLEIKIRLTQYLKECWLLSGSGQHLFFKDFLKYSLTE